MLETGIALISAANNHNSRLAMESTEYWAQRTPLGSKPARLTFGQLIESLEEGVENERLAKWLESEEGKSLMKPEKETSIWSKLWSKTKAKVSNAGGIGGVLGKLLKGIFHTLALVGLSFLLHVQGSEMNPVEEGRAITALMSEILHFAGNIGRKVLNWLWGKGKVFKRSMMWFNDALKEGASSLVKKSVSPHLPTTIGSESPQADSCQGWKCIHREYRESDQNPWSVQTSFKVEPNVCILTKTIQD